MMNDRKNRKKRIISRAEFKKAAHASPRPLIKGSGSKGEFEPLSSLLVSQMQFSGKPEADERDLPLSSDLKLADDSQKADCTLLVGSLTLGKGDDELGERLLHQYFRALLHQSTVPLHIVFLNTAVKLTEMDSPIARQLKALKEMGCAIHADRTSLEYFEISDVSCLATAINSTGLAQLILESPRVITLP